MRRSRGVVGNLVSCLRFGVEARNDCKLLHFQSMKNYKIRNISTIGYFCKKYGKLFNEIIGKIYGKFLNGKITPREKG